jgi:hypothetical protein
MQRRCNRRDGKILDFVSLDPISTLVTERPGGTRQEGTCRGMSLQNLKNLISDYEGSSYMNWCPLYYNGVLTVEAISALSRITKLNCSK